jgi:hypothetical protein
MFAARNNASGEAGRDRYSAGVRGKPLPRGFPCAADLDSAEPLDRVLAVIGALYGVKLTTPELPAIKPAAKARSISAIAAEKTAAARTPRSRTATTRPPRRASATKPDPASVRSWAKANGHDVNDRGRVPAKVTDAYVAAGSPTG